MCFSARISFLAGGLLLSIAFATLRKVTRRSEIPLALVPIIFSFQQLAEGILWLVVPTNRYPILATLAKYSFLSIALIVWPLFIPISILALEQDRIRRAIIALFLVLGIGWSLATFWYMVHFGASVQIRSCHLYYELVGSDTEAAVRLLLYCLITVGPFFASSNYSLRILGALISISCVLTYFVWYQFLVSIWCFFAALLSLAVYKIISDMKAS